MNQLVCTNCGKQISLNEKLWRCGCGSVLDIEFEPDFPLDKIKQRNKNMWRYREAIPIDKSEDIISFDEGFTPLTKVNLDGRSVLIKQDHLFSTGSFKDRGASVLVSKIKELGIDEVVEDSSGNAGCAIAAYCARAGISCEIFVPKSTPSGKLAQIELYGAKLNKVTGSREDTARAVIQAIEESQRYYASHSWNPFFFHGTKTFAYEVSEQLGWKAPDSVVLPVGNGTLLLGAYIGFNELINADIIEKLPKIIGVQAKNCAPLYKAYQEKLETVPKIEVMDTIAEGIAIAKPIRGKQILKAIRKSNGEVIVVEDHEIVEALRKMCNQGFFIEPTAAATIAGLNKYSKRINQDELVVSVFTGHGKKTTDKIQKIMDSN